MVTVVAWARNEIRQHIQITYIPPPLSPFLSLCLVPSPSASLSEFRCTRNWIGIGIVFYDFYEARALIALTVCGGVMAKKGFVERGRGKREAEHIAAIILLDDFR